MRFAGDCATLHVEKELAVERCQLQDDVVRRDGQECPLRLATSLRKKCSVREGLAVDRMHALDDLEGEELHILGEDPHPLFDLGVSRATLLQRLHHRQEWMVERGTKCEIDGHDGAVRAQIAR